MRRGNLRINNTYLVNFSPMPHSVLIHQSTIIISSIDIAIREVFRTCQTKQGHPLVKWRKKRRRITYLILFGVLILIIGLALVYDNRKALGLGGGAALLIIFLIRILPDLIEKPINRRIKKARRADRGAIAEEKIGDLLAELGEDFLILHDVVCAYGNIDHVVIGKNSGVFLLETKAHGGSSPDSI